MAFFMIAIEGEDAEVYGVAAGIIGVILLVEGIINTICLRRAYKEEAKKSPKIINPELKQQ